MEIKLESLMLAELGTFLSETKNGNKGNGYHLGHKHWHGKRLEFMIPRERYGNFHPQIHSILRKQEEEYDWLVCSLYTKGRTQSQVIEVFDEIYGERYRKPASPA